MREILDIKGYGAFFFIKISISFRVSLFSRCGAALCSLFRANQIY